MAWAIVPTADVDCRNWEFVKQFFYARREKAIAAGAARWPRSSDIWASGAITAVTATTVTVDGVAWDTNRWVSFSDPDLYYAPANYDLIIENCPPDPRTIIRAAISANTSDTLTVANLTQFITERRYPSLASLVGKRAVVTKRGERWGSEGWIEPPNDNVIAHGRIKVSAAGTLTAKALTPALGASLVGLDILFWNATPTLQRGSVATQVGEVLTFTGTTGAAVANAEFVVVAAGGLFRWPAPGSPPAPGSIRSDYRGLMTSYYSHDAQDAQRGMPKAQVNFQSYEGGDPFACPTEPTTIVVFDKDYWTAVQEACVDADHSYAPDINKTFRHLWVGQAQEVSAFVNPIDYTGAASIPTLTIATWMNATGINSQTVSGGTVSAGEIPYSISAPYTPIDIFYTVLADNGDTVIAGDGVYTGSGDTLGDTLTSDNDGASIVISFGPTRQVARAFQRMYAKTLLLPSVDDGLIVWPPTEDFPGNYVTRDKSDHYLATDQYGFVEESTLAADIFMTGDLALYSGDNFGNPSIEPHLETTDTEPRIGNYERFFTGTRRAAVEVSLWGQKVGTATAGTVRQLTDTDKNWWGGDFYGDGQIFTRTGTATGGSTTTLIDTTQAASAFWDDATRNQVGLVVTVTLSGVDHKRLITSHTGTTIGFTEALPATASGQAYAIRETDAEANRYLNRTVTLSKPNLGVPGTMLTSTATIAGNDDTTLFFTVDNSFIIDNTTTYKIKSDHRTGGTWKWDGSTWIVPTGTDTRTGRPFPNNQRIIAPTVVTRYGWPRLGDLFGGEEFIELYNAYNKLSVTKAEAFFRNRIDPDVPEANFVADGAQSGGDTCVSYPDTTSDPALADVPVCSINPVSGIKDYSFLHDEITMANHRFERSALTPLTEAIQPPQAGYTLQRHYAAASDTPNTYGEKPADTEIANANVTWSRLWTSRSAVDCGSFTATIKWFCYSQIDSSDHLEGSSDGSFDLYNFEPGPEPLLYHAWAEVASTSSSPATQYHSRKIGGGPGGTFVHPDPPTIPPETDPAPVDADTPGPLINHFGGFYVSDQCALIDWSGAFVYL